MLEILEKSNIVYKESGIMGNFARRSMSPCGRYVATLYLNDERGQLRMVDVIQQNNEYRSLAQPFMFLSLNDDDKEVVAMISSSSSSYDYYDFTPVESECCIRFYNIATGELNTEINCRDKITLIGSLHASPDKDYVFVSSDCGKYVSMIDIRPGDTQGNVRRIYPKHTPDNYYRDLNFCCATREKAIVFYRRNEFNVYVGYNFDDESCTRYHFFPNNVDLCDVSFTRDGDKLIGLTRETIFICDITQRDIKFVKTLRSSDITRGLGFPEGCFLIHCEVVTTDEGVNIIKSWVKGDIIVWRLDTYNIILTAKGRERDKLFLGINNYTLAIHNGKEGGTVRNTEYCNMTVYDVSGKRRTTPQIAVFLKCAHATHMFKTTFIIRDILAFYAMGYLRRKFRNEFLGLAPTP